MQKKKTEKTVKAKDDVNKTDGTNWAYQHASLGELFCSVPRGPWAKYARVT